MLPNITHLPGSGVNMHLISLFKGLDRCASATVRKRALYSIYSLNTFVGSVVLTKYFFSFFFLSTAFE